MNRREFLRGSTLVLGFGALGAIRIGAGRTYDFDLIYRDGLILDGTDGDAEVALHISHLKTIGQRWARTGNREHFLSRLNK